MLHPLPGTVAIALVALAVSSCSAEKPASANALDATGTETRPVEPDVASPDAEVTRVPSAPARCGDTAPGAFARSALPAFDPDYERDLSELDGASPSHVDLALQDLFIRSYIRYMLEFSGDPKQFSRDELRKRGAMGRAVLGAVAKGENGKADFEFLRRGLHHFYPCVRPIPGSIEELRNRYGDYKSWKTTDIACSKPKNSPRRIFENATLGVFVTETIQNGAARETEVIFTKLRKDGQLDFASYDKEGALSDQSAFASAGGADIPSDAPSTCLGCHLESETVSFTKLFPTGTGAGCE